MSRHRSVGSCGGESRDLTKRKAAEPWPDSPAETNFIGEVLHGYAPAMPHIDVRGLTMYFEFHGDGPPLLHISGSGADLRTTMPDRTPLNRTFTGLHYDQRGLGQTSPGDAQPTMEDFADDAAALCAVQGWDRCHVMGTSFGGMVAQHLAIRHRELVDRLVLNCTSPGGDAASYPLHELQHLSAEERADVWMPLMDTRYVAGEDLPGLEGFTQLFRDRQSAELSAEAAAGNARQLEARRHHDATAGLGSITAPTLVCAGKYDAVAPIANSEKLVAAIPDATLKTFEGGHIFMLQDPEAMPRIRDFLLA
ncbi:MAG: 3-oxoadipate enol-lactonase [Candidatus Aldehydirespiratoraceae bacterium]|jgi:3-oxoadipate enol-lactonase